MSDSVHPSESSPSDSKERPLMTASSSFGRPLSMIESIGSSPDEEDLSTASGKEEKRWSPPPETSPQRSGDLKMQINELLKINHTLAADEDEEDSNPAEEPTDHDTILLKDLPKLLAEYERVKGRALLNEEARPVLDQYVQASPNLPLEADSLLEMIKVLNASRDEADCSSQGDKDYSEEERDVRRGEHIRRQSGTSESETDISTGDDHSQSDSNNDASNRKGIDKSSSTSSTRAFEFPRSQSEKYITTSPGTVAAAISHEPTSSIRRKKTTSDPSAPSLEPRPRSGSQNKSKAERQRNGDSEDRDVLRGKGKAKVPPSSWPNSRPRPPALSRRSRRISDISSNKSDYYEQEDIDSSSPLPTSSSQYSHLGMGTPSGSFQRAPRQRMSSQPEIYKGTSAGKFPRSISSASSGFVFPRASAPYDEESGENLHSDGWDHVSGELASSPLPRSASGVSVPRNGSERAASPSLDETSYQNFNALSPFASPASPGLDSVRNPTRRTSGVGRRREAENEEGDETMIDGTGALRARLEATQRQLLEKDRQNDAVQQEHETLISRLQDELEDTRAQINARKKEVKDNKVRENSHMDSIATLEADLNKTEKALETTRDHLTKAKIDYDDQIVETNRLRVKVNELQEELQRFKAEERIHAETARAWEGDRETYRKTIKELHEHVDEVEAEMRRLQEGERETRVLKEQMERMTTELEEVRRGSMLRGPHTNGSDTNGTLSKRLGSELAREIAKGAMRAGSADESGEVEGLPDSDDSSDATFVVQRIKKRTRVDGAIEGAPPPYDVAALEKQFSDRLHPEVETEQQIAATVEDRSYHAILHRTGKRCAVLEESLKTYKREHAESAEDDTLEEPLSLGLGSWNGQATRIWQAWTRFVFTALAWITPFFHIPKSRFESKVKESKGRMNTIALLTTGVLLFAIGLGIGLLYSSSQNSKSLPMEKDFAISNALSLHPETLFHHDTSWIDRYLLPADGRPVSRMPT